MADILLDEQGFPSTPSAGQMVAYPDSSSSKWVQKNDAGLVGGDDHLASIAQQASFSANTYMARSGLILPSHSMQAGMAFEWKFLVTKTAGVAAPVYTIVIGPNQSVADTVRLTFTGPAQTAVVDSGFITILVVCRSVSAVGVLQGSVWLQHNLAATGLAATGPAGAWIAQVTSAGFDNTALGGQYVSLCINPGASAAWVIESMLGRVYY